MVISIFVKSKVNDTIRLLKAGIIGHGERSQSEEDVCKQMQKLGHRPFWMTLAVVIQRLHSCSMLKFNETYPWTSIPI